MTLVFVYTQSFVVDWVRLRMSEEDQRQMELQILQNPGAAPVMQGTGGVRKIRFAPAGRGKSGGVRIIYGYFPAQSHVYLLVAFRKNEQGNLTPKEKVACRELMSQISGYLNRRSNL